MPEQELCCFDLSWYATLSYLIIFHSIIILSSRVHPKFSLSDYVPVGVTPTGRGATGGCPTRLRKSGIRPSPRRIFMLSCDCFDSPSISCITMPFLSWLCLQLPILNSHEASRKYCGYGNERYRYLSYRQQRSFCNSCLQPGTLKFLFHDWRDRSIL